MLGSKELKQKLIDIFKRGNRLSYSKGEYVVRPGEHNTAIFFIESGTIKAFDITKYGEENLLVIRQTDEVFPLIWAITGQERNAIYQVLEDAVLWRISREDFLKEIKNQPSLMAPILDMTIEMYRVHSERIIGLEYRTVRERLVAFILSLEPRFGKKHKNEIALQVPLRHQDIASSINATRETTGRELNGLERKGLVRVEKSIIYITDKQKLRSILE